MRSVCILINSKTKDSLPNVENLETWDDFARIALVDDKGGEEWQYISAKEIEKMKIDDAAACQAYSSPKIKSVAQFLEQKFGAIFLAYKDTVPNGINNFLDSIEEKRVKKFK